ncbi:hypothetical protein AX774_g6337 [Zancudomyces culisetae]|uniref:NADH dehydrogenase [ubiquinone] 1 beta subcomplex subunit 8, mitochondrial n=1 Tax=Zancudomyces culisetae TaxID=1213189 RepID=A0A1R1PGV7_ZANCU|nr:hypothetical protein AX774_g6337 [Zancudomyces culisetae]|eukprot:OMH80235.1 hypothetical protein AX774_g6337 [Zancudomyces culisetae]
MTRVLGIASRSIGNISKSMNTTHNYRALVVSGMNGRLAVLQQSIQRGFSSTTSSNNKDKGPIDTHQLKFKDEGYVDLDPQTGNYYPNLPLTKAEKRTPYGWWDRQMRRNFGDPVHEHEEMLHMQSNSVYRHPAYSLVFKQWATLIGLLGLGGLWAYYMQPERVAVSQLYLFCLPLYILCVDLDNIRLQSE